MKIFYISVLFVMFIFSGCSSVRYIDELLVLKDLAREQEQVADHIEQQNYNFERLLNAYDDQSINQYTSKNSYFENFGDPILKQTSQDNQIDEVWLYRYATNFFHSQKIYVHFDKVGSVVRIEYKNPSP